MSLSFYIILFFATYTVGRFSIIFLLSKGDDFYKIKIRIKFTQTRMQAVYVWLFSCFSTQVSRIFPFFYIFVCPFSKKVKFSLPQKTKFQKYTRDIRRVLFKRCSMYVSVGRERINSIQQKRGWTQWITMAWQPFDFCISVLTLFISRNAFFFPTMLFQGCTFRETWNQLSP